MQKSGRLASVLAALLVASALSADTPSDKPLLTLDEFFNAVEIHDMKISPDGASVVIETSRANWEANRFRTDLWIYKGTDGKNGTLSQLTQSGHDEKPEWSPDGRWIAFLSDRRAPDGEKPEEKTAKAEAQLYLISPAGGEALPVTAGEDEVHAFAWSPDSRLLYYATHAPWPKDQQEAYKKEWNDVVQFRESERDDVIWSVEVASVLAKRADGTSTPAATAGQPRSLGRVPYLVKQLASSPLEGGGLAYLTDARSKRQESLDAYGIYWLDSHEGPNVTLSRTQAIYDLIRWAPDGRHLFFSFLNGSVEGKYQDTQPRVYWLDSARGVLGQTAGPGYYSRWAARFPGAVTDYAVLPDGKLLAAGRMGTEVQPYLQRDPRSEFQQIPGEAGSYEHFSAALRSPRVAFVHSSLEHPPEVYLAEDLDNLKQARQITAFNLLFTQRALPHGKPYRWTADDGALVEGMLIYPPGKFEARNLPTLTLIHGGPADADGNRFEADWYQWGALAATHGWLVFEPNYRGSIGYGDEFTLGVIVHIVSRPGKDILEGIDALVRDGIADRDRLTLGGYSYGGYMTNWLITQSDRFKAAVSGAGALEHVANWGNDDTTLDDAYFLGGNPWEAQRNYEAEAAIWQFSKVRTPTHIVGGAEDIRVYVGEDYLLERALHSLGVPAKLLIFPGEGHSLDKNPWHGKIKVREELKWLEKYGGGK